MLYGTFIAVITGFYVGCVGVVKEQGYNNDSVYAEITCKKKSNKYTLTKSAKEWEERCKQILYFDSFEAKRLGLIDEVIKY